MSLMTIGSIAAYYLITGPQVALSQMGSQVQADMVVESLQQIVRRGKFVTLATENNQLVGKLDGATIPIPSNCSFLSSYNNKAGVFVKCVGSTSSTDSLGEAARVGIAPLVGADPCNSDLFPLPAATPASGQMYLCQESDNPPASPVATDPLQDGHFDLDSYPGYRTKGLHVHAWDDKYVKSKFNLMRTGDNLNCGLTSADICAPLGAPKAIPEVIGSSQFYLLATNAVLSPMVMIQYKYTNSSNVLSSEITCTQDTSTISGARTFDRCFVDSPTSGTPTALKFTAATGTPPSGVNRLEYLNVGFSRNNPHDLAGLMPTTTGLVNVSSPKPGKDNDYRNGAFVIQAVSAIPSTLYRLKDSAPTKLAGVSISESPYCDSSRCFTSSGGTGLAVSNVTYEMSLFWHAPGAVYSSTMNPMYIPGDASSVVVYARRAAGG